MAKKSKASQASTNAVNKHILARVSYLHEAARYLQRSQLRRPTEDRLPDGESMPSSVRSVDEQVLASGSENAGIHTATTKVSASRDRKAEPRLKECSSGEQRRLVSHQKGVSLKGRGQARLPVSQKRTLCRRCETLLIEPSTCTVTIENKSKGGTKPWADVKVVRCLCCGTEKRFPIGIERQVRKGQRDNKPGAKNGTDQESNEAAEMPVGRRGKDEEF